MAEIRKDEHAPRGAKFIVNDDERIIFEYLGRGVGGQPHLFKVVRRGITASPIKLGDIVFCDADVVGNYRPYTPKPEHGQVWDDKANNHYGAAIEDVTERYVIFCLFHVHGSTEEKPRVLPMDHFLRVYEPRDF